MWGEPVVVNSRTVRTKRVSFPPPARGRRGHHYQDVQGRSAVFEVSI